MEVYIVIIFNLLLLIGGLSYYLIILKRESKETDIFIDDLFEKTIIKDKKQIDINKYKDITKCPTIKERSERE